MFDSQPRSLRRSRHLDKLQGCLGVERAHAMRVIDVLGLSVQAGCLGVVSEALLQANDQPDAPAPETFADNAKPSRLVRHCNSKLQ